MKTERKLEPYEQQFLMLFCEGIRLAHQKRQPKEATRKNKNQTA